MSQILLMILVASIDAVALDVAHEGAAFRVVGISYRSSGRWNVNNGLVAGKFEADGSPVKSRETIALSPNVSLQLNRPYRSFELSPLIQKLQEELRISPGADDFMISRMKVGDIDSATSWKDTIFLLPDDDPDREQTKAEWLVAFETAFVNEDLPALPIDPNQSFDDIEPQGGCSNQMRRLSHSRIDR